MENDQAGKEKNRAAHQRFLIGCHCPAMEASGSETDKTRIETTTTSRVKKKGIAATVIKNVVAPLSCPPLSDGLSILLNKW